MKQKVANEIVRAVKVWHYHADPEFCELCFDDLRGVGKRGLLSSEITFPEAETVQRQHGRSR